jgi:hypothetical protein
VSSSTFPLGVVPWGWGGLAASPAPRRRCGRCGWWANADGLHALLLGVVASGNGYLRGVECGQGACVVSTVLVPFAGSAGLGLGCYWKALCCSLRRLDLLSARRAGAVVQCQVRARSQGVLWAGIGLEQCDADQGFPGLLKMTPPAALRIGGVRCGQVACEPRGASPQCSLLQWRSRMSKE